jgi:hypothetical protein
MLTAATLTVLAAASAHAVDYQFNGAAGTPLDYNTPGNWTPSAVPGATDAAFIAGGRIATIATPAIDLLSFLSLGANGSAGSGELRISNGSLTTGSVQLGHDAGTAGFGLLAVSGGAFTSTGATVLGEQGTGANAINVSGGTLTLGGETYLGANGAGSLSLSGAGVVNAGRINVGNGANSSGAVALTGGTLTATDTMYVGLRGLGTYTQSAGSATISRMQVGQENDGPSGGPPGDGKGKGTVNVSGGTLDVSNPIVLGEQSREDNQLNVTGGTVSAAEIYGGANGRGSVSVSGTGTLNVVGQMHLGAGGTGIGSLSVTGGNLNMTGPGGWILVGQNGQGTFNFTSGAIDTKIISVGQDPTSAGTATQTGGTLRSQLTFIVSETSVTQSTYSVSAGSIEVGTAGLDPDGFGIFVGSYSGNGVFNISGTAAVSDHSGITIGYGEGSSATGVVNLSGGSLSTLTPGVEGRVRIGVYGGSTGTLNITGGTASFAGPILNGVARGGVGVGGTGHVIVGGGSLTAQSMLNEAGSTYVQSAGTASLGEVTGGGSMDVSGGTANVARLEQSSLSVAGTGTVRIAPSAVAVHNEVETLTASGSGKLDITNNGLIVDYTGASPIASIRTALAAGRIVATLTPADARQAVAYGEASEIGLTLYAGMDVDSTSLLLQSRLKGDADLSGTVDFDDLLALAQNYSVTGTGVWTDGDFNYDAAVNFDDLLALAQNYSASVVLGSTIGSESFQQDWALALSLVPEPTSLSLLALGTTTLRRRRN